MMWIDARLPLRFGSIESRTPHETVLTDAMIGTEAASITHAQDCTCCTPRSRAALALAQLFRDRAVGQGPMFRGVLAVVSPEVEAAIRDALVNDPVAAGRFRV